MLSNVTHSRFNPECNTERGFIESLYIALGTKPINYLNQRENRLRDSLGKFIALHKARYMFVAFCSFFPCSLTVFHRGRQQKSGGRQ